MKESTFRMILGIWLVVALYSGMHLMTLALVGLLLFEGITNWRIPVLLTRLREKPVSQDGRAGNRHRIPFDAERMLRLLIVLFLMISYVIFPHYLWWVPWFIAFALLGAGLSGVCPMVMMLRWVGFQ